MTGIGSSRDGVTAEVEEGPSSGASSMTCVAVDLLLLAGV